MYYESLFSSFFKIEYDGCNVPRCLITESEIYKKRMCVHNNVDEMYPGVGFIGEAGYPRLRNTKTKCE